MGRPRPVAGYDSIARAVAALEARGFTLPQIVARTGAPYKIVHKALQACRGEGITHRPTDARDAPKRRRCLRCGAAFYSDWAGNRICGPCKGRAEWRSPAAATGANGLCGHAPAVGRGMRGR